MKTRTAVIAKGVALVALVALTGLVACDEPAEPDVVEIDAAYLVDQANGDPLPAPICEEGSVGQSLEFESVALREDATYGRLQLTRVDDDPVRQEEEGDFVRTDSTILLINAADDTLVLTLLDEDGERLRRINPCGDTLRYDNVPVAGTGD